MMVYYELKGYHNVLHIHSLYNRSGNVDNRTFFCSVLFWPEGGDFGQPIGIGPGAVNWYGSAVSPNFQFDPATDLCTSVTGMPANAVTLGMVINDQVADANPNGPIVNRYEPGPKKMYLVFQYNGNDFTQVL